MALGTQIVALPFQGLPARSGCEVGDRISRIDLQTARPREKKEKPLGPPAIGAVSFTVSFFWLGDSVPLLKWTTAKVGSLILTPRLEDLATQKKNP